MAREALAAVAVVASEIKAHQSGCTEAWRANYNTLEEIKSGQRQAFWWTMSVLGTIAGSVILALAVVLMHALVKANVL